MGFTQQKLWFQWNVRHGPWPNSERCRVHSSLLMVISLRLVFQQQLLLMVVTFRNFSLVTTVFSHTPVVVVITEQRRYLSVSRSILELVLASVKDGQISSFQCGKKKLLFWRENGPFPCLRLLIGGLEHVLSSFPFFYWECHHPNWLSLHHFSERYRSTTNQIIINHH